MQSSLCNFMNEGQLNNKPSNVDMTKDLAVLTRSCNTV